MPIAASDISLNYSGGSANSNPDLSLGGARSSVAIPDATTNNIFDDVQGAEVISGDTEYRCFYIKNNNPSTDFNNVKVWISQKTPAITEEIQIGMGTASKGGTEQSVANENTAPSGVVFVDAATVATALDVGDIGNSAGGNSHKAIWIKRIVNPNSQTFRSDFFVIRVEGVAADRGLDLDAFGIRKFFSTKSGGKEWFSTAWNSNPRVLASGTFDPNDADLGFHIGSPSPTRTMVINGDGTATFPETMGPSDTRRIFVNGPNWLNTEITVYARWRTTIFQSFQLRSRSNHHGTNSLPYGYDSANDISCGFGNYVCKWSEAGDTSVSTEVEVIHDLYKRSLDPHTYTLPAVNIWTGFKQITRTIGETVVVQGYINYDITDQNAWTKVTEFTFDGANIHVDPTGWDLNISTCVNAGDKIAGQLDHNTLWKNSGKWSWIRINGGDDIDIKFFSVREIAP